MPEKGKLTYERKTDMRVKILISPKYNHFCPKMFARGSAASLAPTALSSRVINFLNILRLSSIVIAQRINF